MQPSFNLGKASSSSNNIPDGQYTIGSNYGNNPLDDSDSDSDISSQYSSSIISSNHSTFNNKINPPPQQISGKIPIMGVASNKNFPGPPPLNFGQPSYPQILMTDQKISLPKVPNQGGMNSYNFPPPPNANPSPPGLNQPGKFIPFPNPNNFGPNMNPPSGLGFVNNPVIPSQSLTNSNQPKVLGPPIIPNMNQYSFPPPPQSTPPPKIPSQNFPQPNFPPPNIPIQNFPQQNFPPPNLPQSNLPYMGQPKLPNNGNPGIAFPPPPSSQNQSLQRVSISQKTIVSANSDGRLESILISNPGVEIFSNNAGPDQSYINVVGPSWSVEKVSKQLESLEPNQDSQWCYLEDDGNFRKYPEDQSKLIEIAFKRGDERVYVTGSNRVSYIIIFGQDQYPHQQTVEEGTIYRTVRRGTKAPNLSFAADDITIWYWADDIGNKWKPYEPEACVLIGSHYNEFKQRVKNIVLSRVPDKKNLAKSEAVLVSGTSGFSYLIDFVNMVQLNEKTGRWRSIKREGMEAEFRVSYSNEAIPWRDHPELP